MWPPKWQITNKKSPGTVCARKTVSDMQNTSQADLLLDWCFCYGIFSIHLLPISCQSLPLMREVAAQKADGGREMARPRKGLSLSQLC